MTTNVKNMKTKMARLSRKGRSGDPFVLRRFANAFKAQFPNHGKLIAVYDSYSVVENAGELYKVRHTGTWKSGEAFESPRDWANMDPTKIDLRAMSDAGLFDRTLKADDDEQKRRFEIETKEKIVLQEERVEKLRAWRVAVEEEFGDESFAEKLLFPIDQKIKDAVSALLSLREALEVGDHNFTVHGHV